MNVPPFSHERHALDEVYEVLQNGVCMNVRSSDQICGEREVMKARKNERMYKDFCSEANSIVEGGDCETGNKLSHFTK